jgi:hypothetical protein
VPQCQAQSAKPKVSRSVPSGTRVQAIASTQPEAAHVRQDSVQAEGLQADLTLASDLIASGVTTQPVETVMAVLASHRAGASINAAAKASGINYRTAQRIVAAVAVHQKRALVAVG